MPGLNDVLMSHYNTSGQPDPQRTYDEQALDLFNAYKRHAGTIEGAMRGTSSDVKQAWYALKSACAAADTFTMLPNGIVGQPQTEITSRYVNGQAQQTVKRLPVPANVYMHQAVDAHQQIIDGVRANAPKLAQALVDAALAGAIPACPDSSSDADVRDRKQDLQALLQQAEASGRNQLAQSIIRQAVKDSANTGMDGVNGQLTLYTMLGGPMTLALQGMPGVNIATLRKVAAKALYEANPRPVVLGTAPYPSNVSGAELINLLDTENDPRQLPDSALAYMDYQLALTKSLMRG